MAVEIQWRLLKAERKNKEDCLWQHHSMLASGDAAITLKIWNENSPFFEYQIGPGKGPPKEKLGPFGFSFSKKKALVFGSKLCAKS
jgi:hypothetical protein